VPNAFRQAVAGSAKPADKEQRGLDEKQSIHAEPSNGRENNYRPHVGWQIALYDAWPEICRTYGRQPTAIEAIRWLKRNDSNGTILNEGNSTELCWKTQRDEKKSVHLDVVKNVISAWRTKNRLVS